MPTYEYRCQKCNKEFTLMMSMVEHDKASVSCPYCKSTDVVQQYSVFFAKTGKGC
jgi:putative FmdB family regulatory protein